MNLVIREMRERVQGQLQEQAKEHTKVYEVNRKKWKAEVVGQINRIFGARQSRGGLIASFALFVSFCASC